MTDYSIKPVYGSDYEKELNRLQEDCFPDDKRLEPTEGGWWWLVRARFGLPVAFASMHATFDRKGVKAYMTRAGVLEKHRGKGLQRLLVRARVAVARKHNFPSVVTTTFENGPSGNNLIACGFRLWEPDETWMAVGTNYWIKHLVCAKA